MGCGILYGGVVLFVRMTIMLDAETMAQLRAELEREKARLERELQAVATRNDDGVWEARAPEDIGNRVDENATEAEEMTDAVALVQTLATQLRDVEDALARMDAGTYGVCEKTGRPIPVERLRAYPAARTVVDA